MMAMDIRRFRETATTAIQAFTRVLRRSAGMASIRIVTAVIYHVLYAQILLEIGMPQKPLTSPVVSAGIVSRILLAERIPSLSNKMGVIFVTI
jgi:hypothetical protein